MKTWRKGTYNDEVWCPNRPVNISRAECLELINEQAEWIASSLSNLHSRAPTQATNLLSEIRLNRFRSLCAAFSNTMKEPLDNNKDEGLRIVCWAHLGSATELLLQIFLAIYIKDFKSTRFWDKPEIKEKLKKKSLPDLSLEPLKKFFKSEVWIKDKKNYWTNKIDKIQKNRNAIHSFKNREIGSWGEIDESLIDFAELLGDLIWQFPILPDKNSINKLKDVPPPSTYSVR
ncbi:MAG: hypothetical protein QME59_05105 [Candidatus Hydrothermarchaeota archaeon]|nr:hypothetical protein [Candidatus Hydrothermarchaeota archaeon]